jgi:hypothetical protein
MYANSVVHLYAVYDEHVPDELFNRYRNNGTQCMYVIAAARFRRIRHNKNVVIFRRSRRWMHSIRSLFNWKSVELSKRWCIRRWFRFHVQWFCSGWRNTGVRTTSVKTFYGLSVRKRRARLYGFKSWKTTIFSLLEREFECFRRKKKIQKNDPAHTSCSRELYASGTTQQCITERSDETIEG